MSTLMASSQVKNSDESLSAQGRSAQRKFGEAYQALQKDYSKVSGQLEPAALVSEMQRFLLWATNLGLFQQDHSSLDYRLRDNEVIRSFTMSLLSSLIEALIEITITADAEDAPDLLLDPGQTRQIDGDLIRGDTSSTNVETKSMELSPMFMGTSNSEAESLLALYFENVTEAIDQLFKLAAQIRSPATRKVRTDIDLYRYIGAEARPVYVRMRETADREGIEQVLLHARRSLLRKEDDYKELVLSDEDQVLVQRLQKANHARRQQFEYWKRTKQKSARATEMATDVELFEPYNDVSKTDAETQDPVQINLKVARSSERSGSKLSSALALPIDFVLQNRSTYSSTSRGLTVHGPSGETISWPEPPNDRKLRKEFECPYCFFICPPKYLTDTAWRTHLKHDLRPYVCTYQSCAEPNILYDSWEDWTSHEQWAHRQRIWRCPEHLEQYFSERSAYEDHVRKSHAVVKHKLLSPELLTAQESVSQACDRPCPFCLRDFEKPSEMQQHVAKHLEIVALLAIPNLCNINEDSQASNANSNSAHHNRGESKAGDFEDMGPLLFVENDEPLQAPEVATSVQRQLFKETLARENSSFHMSNEVSFGSKAQYSRTIALRWLSEKAPHDTGILRSSTFSTSSDPDFIQVSREDGESEEPVPDVADHMQDPTEPEAPLGFTRTKTSTLKLLQIVISALEDARKVRDTKTNVLRRLAKDSSRQILDNILQTIFRAIVVLDHCYECLLKLLDSDHSSDEDVDVAMRKSFGQRFEDYESSTRFVLKCLEELIIDLGNCESEDGVSITSADALLRGSASLSIETTKVLDEKTKIELSVKAFDIAVSQSTGIYLDLVQEIESGKT